MTNQNVWVLVFGKSFNEHRLITINHQQYTPDDKMGYICFGMMYLNEPSKMSNIMRKIVVDEVCYTAVSFLKEQEENIKLVVVLESQEHMSVVNYPASDEECEVMKGGDNKEIAAYSKVLERSIRKVINSKSSNPIN